MPKLSAVTALVLASLAVPALASAAPTASQITAPTDPSFVIVDPELPQSLEITGTTSGGAGDIDIRCYHGSTSALIAGPVAVDNGAFSTGVALDLGVQMALGYPRPYCTLRAVPTGTEPAAAPGSASDWSGPAVGWGEHSLFRIGAGFDPTPPETVYDYELAVAQPEAFNYLDSATSCGLCDTFLFVPGTKAISNSIWYVNAGLFRAPYGVSGRTAVNVDGVPAYGTAAAYYNSDKLVDKPGLPAISVSTSVDPLTGDMTVDEHAEFKHCAPDPMLVPPTSSSCTSFTDSGVVLERRIRVTGKGMLVTFADRWKSVDGQAHELDLLYEDSEHSENAMTSGHEARLDFTWTQDGFNSYGPDQKIALPDRAPATILVKTDATTPATGDNANPFGAVTYGTLPSELSVVSAGRIADENGRWHPRYLRTVPAGGEVLIATAYSHDLSLDGAKARAVAAEELLVPRAAAESPVPAPEDTGSGSPGPAGPQPQTTPPPTVTPLACVVPKLRGKSLAKAKRLLKRSHCRLGKVARKVSSGVKPGRVVGTRFKVGSRHPAGARVRVTIAAKARRRT